MEKHHYKLLILAFVIIAVASVFIVKFSKVQENRDSIVLKSTPAPVPVVEAQESILTSVGSPDGKSTLTMREESSTEGPVYNFFTTNLDGNKNLLFTKTASVGAALSIPANTFSPDNKYVFLKEEYAGLANYFVLSVDQSPNSLITPNPLNFSDLFKEKYDNYKITEVTGWGGVNLIVINTDKVDGGVGPSFWFDVPSKSFIRLSTRFN